MAITIPSANARPIQRTYVPSFLGRTTDVLTKANNSYAGAITIAQTAHTTTAKGILNTGTVSPSNAGDFQILIPVIEVPDFWMGKPVAINKVVVPISKPADSVGTQTVGNGTSIYAMQLLLSESTVASVTQGFNATPICSTPIATQYLVGAAAATVVTASIDKSAVDAPVFKGQGICWISINVVVPTGSGTCRYDIQLDGGAYIEWYPVLGGQLAGT